VFALNWTSPGSIAVACARPGEHHGGRHAAGDQERTVLAFAPVLLRDQVAVLAGNDPQTDSLLIVHLHAISADVDVAAVRIVTNHGIESADITAAVLFMPLRRCDNFTLP